MAVKILIVDDDDEIRKVLRVLLRQTGYELLEARDAETAFGLLREQAAHVGAVICDVRLPRVSGIGILERMTQEYKTLPVIVLTAMAELSVAVEAMKKGAFDFLAKPAKKDELILAIEKALNHKSLLDSYVALQEQHERDRRNFEHRLDEKTRALEEALAQLRQTREELTKLNAPHQ